MTETLNQHPEEPVRSYELDLSVTPLANCRSTLNAAHQYQIKLYALFPSYRSCFICGRPHQAQQVVLIENKSTGNLFEAGLDCLEKNFNIDRKILFKTVSTLNPLLNDWKNFFGEVQNSRLPEFSSSQAALNHMLDNLDLCISLPSRATSDAKTLIHSMINKTGNVQSGDFDDDIQALRGFLAIQREHKFFHWMFEARKLFFSEHPYLSESSSQQFKPLFEEDSEVTLFQYKRLLNQTLKKRINFKIDEMPPYKAPDETIYRLKLRDEMVKIADSVKENFEKYYYFNPNIADAAKELKEKGGGRKILALASNDEFQLQNYDPYASDYVRRSLKGMEIYISPITRKYKTSGIKLDKSTGKPQDTEVEEGYYRGAVIWQPEEYYGAHSAIFSVQKKMGNSYGAAEAALTNIFSLLKQSVKHS